ncbi:hypothetical protein [Acidovorax sp. LjRoot194]|uniref:hypothetical protein n=1 Tax=Acidovorax sp. LjRoot194 TaxID=3342280 RepID=UPI003ECF281A
MDASPWGPLEGPGDVLGGALLYELREGGAHALMAVRPVPLALGLRLDVVGLVSLGDRMRSGAIDQAACGIAAQLGAGQVAMCTKQEHVARQCARHGWIQTGVVMTKGLYVQQ